MSTNLNFERKGGPWTAHGFSSDNLGPSSAYLAPGRAENGPALGLCLGGEGTLLTNFRTTGGLGLVWLNQTALPHASLVRNLSHSPQCQIHNSYSIPSVVSDKVADALVRRLA